MTGTMVAAEDSLMALISRDDPIWTTIPALVLPEPAAPAPPALCVHAQRLVEFAEQLYRQLRDKPQPIAFNQARLLLTDRYMALRSAAPRSHQNHLGRRGHRCLFPVFIDAYEQIRALELSTAPPALALPAKTPKPQFAAPPGIYLGEVERKSG